MSAGSKTSRELVKIGWLEREKGYREKNIYCAGQSGLVYNTTCDAAFRFKDLKRDGGKRPQESLRH
jgi:hypothetical protein